MRRVVQLFDSEHIEALEGMCVIERTDDSEVQTAEAVMGQLGTINVDDRAEQWEGEGWNGFDPNNQPLRDVRARSDDLSTSGLSDSDPASRKP